MSAAPASAEPTLRRAEAADAAAMVVLESLAFPQPWTHDQLASELLLPTSLGLVAEVGDRLAGYAVFRRALDEVELLRLAVAKDWQRHGLASQLVAHGFDRLRVLGSTVAFLEVREDNLAAIRFYESTGWRAAGRRPRYYTDGSDALLYRREI